MELDWLGSDWKVCIALRGNWIAIRTIPRRDLVSAKSLLFRALCSFHYMRCVYIFFLLASAEDAGELAGYGITHLCCLGLATDIRCPNALVNDDLDGFVDRFG